MESFLPFLFMSLSAVALLLSISFLWGSLRTLLGGEHELYVAETSAAQRHAELLTEKEEHLKSLKDLEFEREVGKLSDEDFKRLTSEIRNKAKKVMRDLDEELREHRQKAHKLVESELKKVKREPTP